jgi:catalase
MPENSNDSSVDQRAPLSPANRRLTLGAILVVVAGAGALFLYAGAWLRPHALTPWRMIGAFEEVNGVHRGFRRNHAKGVCIRGSFDSNGEGVALSKASLFKPGRVPVIGRFALAGGQPYQADAPHTVRSMAIQFNLLDGEEWRTGMNNIPVFPVNTPRGFYEQLLASAPDPATGKPDPARMAAFLTRHPESAKAMQMIRSHPVSSGFDNSTFNSLNAFRFIHADGRVVPVRWSMVPVQRFEPISMTQPAHPAHPAHPAQSAEADKNYLFDALIASIHRGPLQWRLVITVGDRSDPTSDATLPWPANRQQIDVGTLTIDQVESEDTSPARDINFDPLVLPNGIASSDDPLLSARSAAYARSFTRREGEPKQPSAVSAAETGK